MVSGDGRGSGDLCTAVPDRSGGFGPDASGRVAGRPGAEGELEDALEAAGPRGYGEDLIRVLRGALQWAENGGPLVAIVRLLPNPLSLPLGSTGGFAVSVEDEFGNPLEVPVTWNSDQPTVVEVDDQGLLTPVADGFATISAEAGGVSGEATVVVIPPRVAAPAPGDRQREPPAGLPSTLLSQPVTVQAVDAANEIVSGIYLDWRVLQGDGSVQPARGITDALGQASARWTVGDRTEPQRLEARIPGSNGVVFRATVVPGAPQAVSILAESAVIPAGGLVTLEVRSEDAVGNQWFLAWSRGHRGRPDRCIGQWWRSGRWHQPGGDTGFGRDRRCFRKYGHPGGISAGTESGGLLHSWGTSLWMRLQRTESGTAGAHPGGPGGSGELDQPASKFLLSPDAHGS